MQISLAYTKLIIQGPCYFCCIPSESYSEVDIVLNEDGRRNVAGKAVFLSEVVDLLKILHKWLLGKGKCMVGIRCGNLVMSQ